MNNKGFSLIELIISVAILTIITSAILGFIVTSSKSYGNVSEDVSLQQEAQLSLNQISDLIVDSTSGLKYYYNDNEALTILSDADISGDVTSKTLAIYNVQKEVVSGVTVENKYIYNIIWRKAEKKIYLRKDSIDSSTGLVTQGNEVLMVEYVTDFNPSLTKVESRKKVSISMTFARNDKNYTASKNFALRNKTIVNGSITDIFDDIQPVVSAVTGVAVTYNNVAKTEVTIWKHNGTCAFGARVTGIGFPSSDVIWNLANASNSTVTPTPTGCIVNLAENETADSLILTATTKALSAEETPLTSEPVVIKIKDITGINLSLLNTAGKLHEGQTFTVTANVFGTSNLTDDDKSIIWTAVGAERVNNTDENACTQTFKITGNNGGKVSIKAVCENNSNIFGEINDIPVEAPEYKITAQPDINSAIGKCSVTVTADVNPKDNYSKEIGWSMYVECWNTTANGWIKFETPSIGDYVELQPNGSSAIVNVKQLFPDKQIGFKIHVTAYLKNNPDVSSTTQIYVNHEGYNN